MFDNLKQYLIENKKILPVNKSSESIKLEYDNLNTILQKKL